MEIVRAANDPFCSSNHIVYSSAGNRCRRLEILDGGIRLSIWLDMEADLSLRLIVIDWRFCNTFPQRSDSVSLERMRPRKRYDISLKSSIDNGRISL